MIDLGLPRTLSSLVCSKFLQAEKSGNLTFSATEVALVRTSESVPLQSRFCPSLAKKPTSKEPKDEKKPKFNPFEKPPEELLVTSVPQSNPTHNVVLNKFPIIRNHFILSTIPWKSQTDLLEPDDLAVAHSLLRAWPSPTEGISRTLFAFFNSGPHSGASQPHRHIQFLPVEDMMSADSPGWRPAIEIMSETCHAHDEYTVQACTAFPFAHFACKLPPDPQPKDLYEAYLSLYSAAVESIPSPKSNDLSITRKAPNAPQETISYNLAMLPDVMAICPRRNEFAGLSGGEGEVGFNGTVMAGTFMLKDEALWRKINESPEEMRGVLEGIGYPFPEAKSSQEDMATQKL